MFTFKKRDSEISKCFFTRFDLPDQLHEKNLPVKKPPFSTIRQRPFIHTVSLSYPALGDISERLFQLDLILPDEICALIEQRLNIEDALPRYARVQMSLLDILSGDFFNQYIKIGQHYSKSQGMRFRI